MKMNKLSDKKRALIKRYADQIEKIMEDHNEEALTIEEALSSFKLYLELSVGKHGEKGKTALIRSQKPIKLIHEAVKGTLINFGINRKNINPELGSSSGELKLAGFLKKKDQDICVVPNEINRNSEVMTEGLLRGQTDKFGKRLTESIISINIRSQMSSLGNNIDTLYERTFAESMNLHLRCPKMCLGELYMIPVYEYDKYEAQKKHVAWVNTITTIENYIKAFSAINIRDTETGDFYKYERVCLLIVDFKEPIPKIYNTDAELKADHLIPADSTASIEHLNFRNFITELMAVYATRFPSNTFN